MMESVGDLVYRSLLRRMPDQWPELNKLWLRSWRLPLFIATPPKHFTSALKIFEPQSTHLEVAIAYKDGTLTEAGLVASTAFLVKESVPTALYSRMSRAITKCETSHFRQEQHDVLASGSENRKTSETKLGIRAIAGTHGRKKQDIVDNVELQRPQPWEKRERVEWWDKRKIGSLCTQLLTFFFGLWQTRRTLPSEKTWLRRWARSALPSVQRVKRSKW